MRPKSRNPTPYCLQQTIRINEMRFVISNALIIIFFYKSIILPQIRALEIVKRFNNNNSKTFKRNLIKFALNLQCAHAIAI